MQVFIPCSFQDICQAEHGQERLRIDKEQNSFLLIHLRRGMVRTSLPTGIYLLALSLFCACGCIAEETSFEISSTGTITYIDLEGGFYGLVTSDGVKYLPLDLPDEFKQDGLKVDFSGVIDPDIMTIQMWGQPLKILSITNNQGFIISDSWYDGEEDLSSEQEMEQATLLLRSSAALSKTLDDFDAKIAEHAAEMKGLNLKDEDIRPYLQKICEENPAVLLVSILDRTGTIIQISHARFDSSIGVNVRDQPLVDSVVINPVPGMSNIIKCIEGEDVIDIIYPLYSSSLSVTGYLSVLAEPALLVESALGSLTKEKEMTIMVTQPDGTLIGYSGELPLSSFSDNTTVQKISGVGTSPAASYVAGHDMLSLGESVSPGKEKYPVYWNTVSLHGTPWRVLVF